LDFSFSGLKTAAINFIHNTEQKGGKVDIPIFAAAFNRAVADALVSRLISAAEKNNIKKIAISGGVSANSAMRSLLTEKCREKGYTLYMPPLPLCVDNAAMVASQGYYEFLAGNIADIGLNAYATLGID